MLFLHAIRVGNNNMFTFGLYLPYQSNMLLLLVMRLPYPWLPLLLFFHWGKHFLWDPLQSMRTTALRLWLFEPWRVFHKIVPLVVGAKWDQSPLTHSKIHLSTSVNASLWKASNMLMMMESYTISGRMPWEAPARYMMKKILLGWNPPYPAK